jgi:hypothetical protein
MKIKLIMAEIYAGCCADLTFIDAGHNRWIPDCELVVPGICV